jgi:hypothetical protein
MRVGMHHRGRKTHERIALVNQRGPSRPLSPTVPEQFENYERYASRLEAERLVISQSDTCRSVGSGQLYPNVDLRFGYSTDLLASLDWGQDHGHEQR